MEENWKMTSEDRIKYARRALEGIALGDCFGETFFVPEEIARKRIRDREIVNEPWRFTDDTVMAIGIYRILEQYGKIDQDQLAKVFAENYALDWHRGYGGTAHSILRSIGEGTAWREAASGAFDGMGSMGNGGAMRAAPIGAYFADDLDKVVYYAGASAEVTHAHIEGKVGAMAAAAGAALLLRKNWGTMREREKPFCGMWQVYCRKAIPNIKYCLRFPSKRKAAWTLWFPRSETG